MGKLSKEDDIEIAKGLVKGKSMRDIAKEKNVTVSSISRHVQKPELKQQIKELSDKEILKVLNEKFVNGTTADRELMLKYIKKWNPAAKIEIEGDITLSNLIKAEKR